MSHQLSDEDQMRFLLEDQEHHTQNLDQAKRQMEEVIRYDDVLYSRDEKLARLVSLAEQREMNGYELGRLSVYIEQHEHLMQEKERLRLEKEQNDQTLAVLDNHLDWLDIEVRPLPAPSEDGPLHEPEHGRR